MKSAPEKRPSWEREQKDEIDAVAAKSAVKARRPARCFSGPEATHRTRVLRTRRLEWISRSRRCGYGSGGRVGHGVWDVITGGVGRGGTRERRGTKQVRQRLGPQESSHLGRNCRRGSETARWEDVGTGASRDPRTADAPARATCVRGVRAGCDVANRSSSPCL